jgi:alanine dehydrogenase
MSKVIGIPREYRPFEYRVGISPSGVSMLTQKGHQVYVETCAGVGSGYNDQSYEQAGARIVYNREEIFRRADLVLKVQRPTEDEASWMKDGQVMMGFMMMANFPQSRIKALENKNVTVIAYEYIQEIDGSLPVLRPLSEIGGFMTAQIAAQYAQNNFGGNGILLGGIPGVPPADVVIVGAGAVGMSATKAFAQHGASVMLMDVDLKKLEQAHKHFQGHLSTLVAYPSNLKKAVKFADVLVSAVQIPGEPAPKLITREMVQSMHPGSLIIDMSIDQGGSVETSRLTFYDNPTYVEEDVIHFCVPNIPGVVGRAATRAFLNAAYPYIEHVASMDIGEAIRSSEALKWGVVIQN